MRWLIILVLLVCSCSKHEATKRPVAFPEMPSKGEWFWKDHLLPEGTQPLVPQPSGPVYDELVKLAGKEPAAIGDAIDRLAQQDASAVPQLAAGLQHEDHTVQYAAVCALGRMRGPSVSRALMLAFRHDRPEIAALAIRGAVLQDEPWAVPRVMTEFGLRDVNRHLVARVVAAAELATRGWLGGIPLLLKVLKDNTPIADESNREWDRRERIAWEKELAFAALAQVLGVNFGYNENAPAAMQADLVRRLEDHYLAHCVEIHARAHEVDDPLLIGIVRRLIGGLNTFQLRNVDDARFLLEALGPPVADHLLEGAFAEPFYIRFHCLEVLARFREEASADQRTRWTAALAPLAGDRDSALREQLATTLGELASPDALKVLERMLTDPELGVRTAAIQALGRLQSAQALSLLATRFAPAPAQNTEQVTALAAQIELGSQVALEPFLGVLAASPSDLRSTAVDLLSVLIGKDLGLASGQGTAPAEAIAEARRLLTEKYLSQSKKV